MFSCSCRCAIQVPLQLQTLQRKPLAAAVDAVQAKFSSSCTLPPQPVQVMWPAELGIFKQMKRKFPAIWEDYHGAKKVYDRVRNARAQRRKRGYNDSFRADELQIMKQARSEGQLHIDRARQALKAEADAHGKEITAASDEARLALEEAKAAGEEVEQANEAIRAAVERVSQAALRASQANARASSTVEALASHAQAAVVDLANDLA